MKNDIQGFVNIYKEKGMTSHDVVYRARRILRTKKIGHTGTLDPNATGVLVLCVGKATKLSNYLTLDDKTYEADIHFGEERDTDDITGQVLRTDNAPSVDAKNFTQALKSFLGSGTQVPPAYSALKVKGKKMYEEARKGIFHTLPARPIHIYRIETLEIKELPHKARFLVECSKGTYVRALCRDIGRSLQTYAAMGDLKRTRVGNFDLSHAITLDELEKQWDTPSFLEEYVTSMEEAMKGYPAVHTKPEADRYLLSGNPLLGHNIVENIKDYQKGDILLLCTSDRLIGIGEVKENAEKIYIQPKRIL